MFRLLHIKGLSERLSEMELELLGCFCVMGDDFIGFGYGSMVFNDLLDLLFGNTTKEVIEPSLEYKEQMNQTVVSYRGNTSVTTEFGT